MPQTRHTLWIERDEDIAVTIEAEWRWDSGHYVERGHSRNGYGAGWECTRLTATGPAGEAVDLTEQEESKAREEAGDRAARREFEDSDHYHAHD